MEWADAVGAFEQALQRLREVLAAPETTAVLKPLGYAIIDLGSGQPVGLVWSMGISHLSFGQDWGSSPRSFHMKLPMDSMVPMDPMNPTKLLVSPVSQSHEDFPLQRPRRMAAVNALGSGLYGGPGELAFLSTLESA